MAVVEVACPGCGTTLKAPANMAGKKARCKKCNTPFRIPGAGQPGDSVGDSQMLSAVEMPAVASLDFGAMEDAAPPPKPAPKAVAKAPEPKPAPRPTPAMKKAAAGAPASDNPFSFGEEPAEEPKPAPRPPKEKPAPVGKLEPSRPSKTAPKKSVPKPQTAAPAPVADDGFNFGSMLDEAAAPPPPASPPSAKQKASAKSVAPAEKAFAMPGEADDDDEVMDAENVAGDDDEDVPDAEAAPEAMSLDDEPEAASDDPFGFPGPADEAPRSSRGKAKPRRSRDDDEEEEEEEQERPRRGGYHKAASGGGKSKLIAAIIGFVLLGGAAAGVAILVSNQKTDEQAKPADTEKKEETPPSDIAPFTNNDPGNKGTTPPTKGTTPPGKGGTTPPTKGPGGDPPPRGALALDKTVKTIMLQPANPKPESFQEPVGAAEIDVPFEKIIRIFPPSMAQNDFGVLWTETPGVLGAGSKLVFDVCRPSGTKQYRINFTGNAKEAACDMSDDGRWIAHVNGGKLTVWKAEDQTKLVDAIDLHSQSPDFIRGGIVAVYFPGMSDKGEMPPKHVVTVTSIGAVHLWDLATKKLVGTGFTPPQGRANRVSATNATTLAPGRGAVIVAVGGAIYHVAINDDGVSGSELHDLGGDVPTSHALAMSGSGPLLYVFETGGDKKERVVRLINTRGVSKSWRWPDAAGFPTGAAWVDGQKAVVSTSRGGILWFELTENNFYPQGFAVPPNNKGLHATNDVNHWYLIPHPSDAARCGLLQLGPTGPTEEPAIANKGIVPTWLLDAKGLSN